jgi:hypothetical protein
LSHIRTWYCILIFFKIIGSFQRKISSSASKEPTIPVVPFFEFRTVDGFVNVLRYHLSYRLLRRKPLDNTCSSINRSWLLFTL